MDKTALPSTKVRRVVTTRKQVVATAPKPTRDSLTVADFSASIESYLIAGDIECHSQTTIQNRRYRLGRVLWLAEKRGWKTIGFPELQQFMLYLNHGHTEGVGRWDKETEKQPLKSGSIKSFHSSLRAFLRWCVKEGELDINPFDRIAAPVDRADQVQPFTEAQVKQLLVQARKTSNPLRNESIICVFIDCALRVSELCALTVGDVDFKRAEIRVLDGKGGKTRYVPFGRSCKHALWQYVQAERRHAEATEPLFLSDRGIDAGVHHIHRRGMHDIISTLGIKANITGVRCSPHTLRHSSAIFMIRGGASPFAVKAMLGHEDLTQTNKYVAMAQADLVNAHRTASPADRIKSGKEGR